jgi:hypothetical protein
MDRRPAYLIGTFLFAVFIAGLVLRAPAWLTWLDLLGAVVAFGVARAPLDRTGPAGRTGLPLVIALGLYAVTFVGLANGRQPWIAWCTFAAATAFVLIAFGGGLRARLQS